MITTLAAVVLGMWTEDSVLYRRHRMPQSPVFSKYKAVEGKAGDCPGLFEECKLKTFRWVVSVAEGSWWGIIPLTNSEGSDAALYGGMLLTARFLRWLAW